MPCTGAFGGCPSCLELASLRGRSCWGSGRRPWLILSGRTGMMSSHNIDYLFLVISALFLLACFLACVPRVRKLFFLFLLERTRMVSSYNSEYYYCICYLSLPRFLCLFSCPHFLLVFPCPCRVSNEMVSNPHLFIGRIMACCATMR